MRNQYDPKLSYILTEAGIETESNAQKISSLRDQNPTAYDKFKLFLILNDYPLDQDLFDLFYRLSVENLFDHLYLPHIFQKFTKEIFFEIFTQSDIEKRVEVYALLLRKNLLNQEVRRALQQFNQDWEQLYKFVGDLDSSYAGEDYVSKTLTANDILLLLDKTVIEELFDLDDISALKIYFILNRKDLLSESLRQTIVMLRELNEYSSLLEGLIELIKADLLNPLNLEKYIEKFQVGGGYCSTRSTHEAFSQLNKVGLLTLENYNNYFAALDEESRRWIEDRPNLHEKQGSLNEALVKFGKNNALTQETFTAALGAINSEICNQLSGLQTCIEEASQIDFPYQDIIAGVGDRDLYYLGACLHSIISNNSYMPNLTETLFSVLYELVDVANPQRRLVRYHSALSTLEFIGFDQPEPISVVQLSEDDIIFVLKHENPKEYAYALKYILACAGELWHKPEVKEKLNSMTTSELQEFSRLVCYSGMTKASGNRDYAPEFLKFVLMHPNITLYKDIFRVLRRCFSDVFTHVSIEATLHHDNPEGLKKVLSELRDKLENVDVDKARARVVCEAMLCLPLEITEAIAEKLPNLCTRPVDITTTLLPENREHFSYIYQIFTSRELFVTNQTLLDDLLVGAFDLAKMAFLFNALTQSGGINSTICTHVLKFCRIASATDEYAEESYVAFTNKETLETNTIFIGLILQYLLQAGLAEQSIFVALLSRKQPQVIANILSILTEKQLCFEAYVTPLETHPQLDSLLQAAQILQQNELITTAYLDKIYAHALPHKLAEIFSHLSSINPELLTEKVCQVLAELEQLNSITPHLMQLEELNADSIIAICEQDTEASVASVVNTADATTQVVFVDPESKAELEDIKRAKEELQRKLHAAQAGSIMLHVREQVLISEKESLEKTVAKLSASAKALQLRVEQLEYDKQALHKSDDRSYEQEGMLSSDEKSYSDDDSSCYQSAASHFSSTSPAMFSTSGSDTQLRSISSSEALFFKVAF